MCLEKQWHGDGYISKCQSYETDSGNVFIKHHSDPKVDLPYNIIGLCGYPQTAHPLTGQSDV